jgi:hypothetical protein
MSKEANYTLGPWSVEEPLGADVGLAIVQAGLKSYEWTFIAMVTRSEPSDSEEVGRVIRSKEQMANARLIAAAPEMFEALTEARDMLCAVRDGTHSVTRLDDIITSATAAIARAKGE